MTSQGAMAGALRASLRIMHIMRSKSGPARSQAKQSPLGVPGVLAVKESCTAKTPGTPRTLFRNLDLHPVIRRTHVLRRARVQSRVVQRVMQVGQHRAAGLERLDPAQG